MRTARAVPPLLLVATMLSTVVPPVSGIGMLNAPLAGTVAVRVSEVWSSWLTALTVIVLPGVLVPTTVVEPVAAERSAGRGDGQRRRALRVLDVAVVGVVRAVERVARSR